MVTPAALVGVCGLLVATVASAKVQQGGHALHLGYDDQTILLKLLAIEERLKYDEKMFDRLLAEIRHGLGSYPEGRDERESIRFT
jgi:hypothetical protein